MIVLDIDVLSELMKAKPSADGRRRRRCGGALAGARLARSAGRDLDRVAVRGCGRGPSMAVVRNPHGLLLAGLAGENGRRVDEAQRIAERILQVERPLAPRPLRDPAHRQLAVSNLRR